jgi:putative DNA primase/helicase
MVDYALHLASLGFAVFPLRPRDKRPLTRDGFKSASKDPAQIQQWWSQWPDANLAIATGAASGVFVVDEDAPGACDPLQLPPTLTASTGKGRHYFFQYPGPSASGAGKIGPHIDHRSDGGYVVAAPSIHPSGARYEWVNWCAPVPLPSSVIAALQRPTQNIPAPASLAPAPAPVQADMDALQGAGPLTLEQHLIAVTTAPVGTIHDTVTKAAHYHACHAHEHGEPIEQAEQRITALIFGAWRMNPGAGDGSNVQASISSAISKAYARQNVLMAYEAEFTEDGLARRFAKLYGPGGAGRACYVPGQGWYLWDGCRWAAKTRDVLPTDLVSAMLIELHGSLVARSKTGDSDAGKLADAVKAKKTAGAMGAILRLAQRYMSVPFEAFDRDPYAVNCTNGTVDLRSGVLREHDPRDMITRSCGVVFDPAASRSQWLRCLNTWTCGDDSMSLYLQVLAGICLRGIGVDKFWYLHGHGGDGKTVFLEALTGAMGDYAGAAPRDSITTHRGGKHKGHTSAAMAFTKRFAYIDEPEQDGSRDLELDLNAIKAWIGRAPVRIQTGMGQDFVDVRVGAKLVIASNYPPKISDSTRGAIRRFVLIPFDADLESLGVPFDDGFAERLIASEGAGILAWAVQGFRMWHAEGELTNRLPDCRRIHEATTEANENNDTIARFLESMVNVAADGGIAKAELHAAYKLWCESMGEFWQEKGAFGAKVKAWGKDRGVRGARMGKDNVHVWLGLRLKHQTPPQLPLHGTVPEFR